MIRRFLRDTSGAAAAELALIVTLLTIPTLSIVDIGIYTYDRMQVNNAAQMAAQSLWATCSTTAFWPVTQFCSSGQSNATLGAQQTSLGTAVTVTSVSDGYYCIDQNGIAQPISTGTYSSPLTATVPSCGTKSGSTWQITTPAEYVTVTVNYTYKPAFAYVSVASLLTPGMTATSMTRIK